MTSSPSVCAYCGATAIHMDHVVPKSLQRKYHQINGKKLRLELAHTVPACGRCNWFKGTRRLVPPSWEHHVPELNDMFSGAPFRVWRGDVAEPAYSEVHRQW